MADENGLVGVHQRVGDAWALFESTAEGALRASSLNAQERAERSLMSSLEVQLMLRHLCRVLVSKGLVSRGEIDQCVLDALAEGTEVKSPFSVSFFP